MGLVTGLAVMLVLGIALILVVGPAAGLVLGLIHWLFLVIVVGLVILPILDSVLVLVAFLALVVVRVLIIDNDICHVYAFSLGWFNPSLSWYISTKNLTPTHSAFQSHFGQTFSFFLSNKFDFSTKKKKFFGKKKVSQKWGK